MARLYIDKFPTEQDHYRFCSSGVLADRVSGVPQTFESGGGWGRDEVEVPSPKRTMENWDYKPDTATPPLIPQPISARVGESVRQW